MGNVNGSLVCTDLDKTSSKSDRTISAETLRAIEHFNLGINRKVAVDNYNNDISIFQAARIIHDIEAGVIGLVNKNTLQTAIFVVHRVF